MKTLLAIAGKVQKGGKHVTAEDVARARTQGATDKEIHDTVLIAAAFCMFNRYVDGLGHMAAPRSRDLPRNRKYDRSTRLRGPGLQEAPGVDRDPAKQGPAAQDPTLKEHSHGSHPTS